MKSIYKVTITTGMFDSEAVFVASESISKAAEIAEKEYQQQGYNNAKAINTKRVIEEYLEI